MLWIVVTIKIVMIKPAWLLSTVSQLVTVAGSTYIPL